MTVLKTTLASCEIRSLGAELTGFKRLDTGIEYLWNGDAKYWGSSSPVLFPIVCALKDGAMEWKGQKYAIGNHGFVRKSEFEVVSATESEALFRQTWSEDTLKAYPFRYELTIRYNLAGSTLKIIYGVTNRGDGHMPFQIGTHPGFRCPLTEAERFEDYYLEFAQEEKLERFFLNPANTLIAGKAATMPPTRQLPLTRELFADGALVFKKVRSRKVTLRSRTSKHRVTVVSENLPALGVWQAKDAPFVCIEPWHGLADTDDFEGPFDKKDLVVTLESQKTFECSLQITVE